MSKVIDFNSYRRPTLILSMKDEDKTKLHVIGPTVELVEELRANLAELQTALSGNDSRASCTVYELAAKLMTCNMDGIELTAEELATKYEMNMEDMAHFYMAYVDFLEDIKNAKN